MKLLAITEKGTALLLLKWDFAKIISTFNTWCLTRNEKLRQNQKMRVFFDYSVSNSTLT